MTDKQCLAEIRAKIRCIESHLRDIEKESRQLEKLYGIRIVETGIQCGREIHLYAGIELVEKALDKQAVETNDGLQKKAFRDNGTEIFQLATPSKGVYRKAEYRLATSNLLEGK